MQITSKLLNHFHNFSYSESFDYISVSNNQKLCLLFRNRANTVIERASCCLEVLD